MRTKAPYTQPCNRCGTCCGLSLCPAAEEVFPGIETPCPALVYNGEKFACGLVIMEEKSGLDKVVSRMLAIGHGCSMPDEDTTDDQIKQYDKLTAIAIYGGFNDAAL